MASVADELVGAYRHGRASGINDSAELCESNARAVRNGLLNPREGKAWTDHDVAALLDALAGQLRGVSRDVEAQAKRVTDVHRTGESKGE